jgi:prolyl-tRNA synthetase
MVEADSGAIGGKASHEFMVLTPTGEDVVIHCETCGYAANLEKACSRKSLINAPVAGDAELLPLQDVATPDCKTIEEVAACLGVPAEATLKAVFYVADGRFVLAVIRGDLEVNEVKLQRVLQCGALRLAEAGETDAAGIVAGYASPIGLDGVYVVADDSVPEARNLVAGANRSGFHVKNANFGRDFRADSVADIALAREGDACPRCAAPLKADKGIEVGHIFKLGTFLSQKLGAVFLDETGVSRPCMMGCYGIGVGRLLAPIVEHCHDDKGIVWPMAVAPYQVYLCTLNPDKDGVEAEGERLYGQLNDAGMEVLYDDRVASPGVKFNDADLLGIPLRVTVSPRTLANRAVEVKWREARESANLPLDGAVERLKQLVSQASGS